MKTTYIKFICAICVICGLMSCSDFLDEQVPQATLTQDEVKNPEYIDNVLISAYAGLVVVETGPDRAERPVGGHHASALLQSVERLTVREVRTANVCVVAPCVIVP